MTIEIYILKFKYMNVTQLLCRIFTARKRSSGQSNVFTPPCHSVHRGGDLHGGGFGQTPPPEHYGYGQQAGILLGCILVVQMFIVI